MSRRSERTWASRSTSSFYHRPLVNWLPQCLSSHGIARTLSSHLQDRYSPEDERCSYSRNTFVLKKSLSRSTSASIPFWIKAVGEQNRCTLTTVWERRVV